MNKEITIFTDGACSGNPGPGGFGGVLVYNGEQKEFSEGYKFTTNNRMELMAVIKGLELVNELTEEPYNVKIFSDSKYIVDAINLSWVYNWERNNWKRNKNAEVMNPDLWKRLLQLMKDHKTTFHWVKGHADTELNNRCDKLAVEATKNPIRNDIVYENSRT